MERRRAERRVPAPSGPLARVRLRTGREFTVLNIACRGALIEGSALLPGSHIDLTLQVHGGRVLMRAFVARCCVARLTASTVVYHSALAFEQSIDVSGDGYAVPPTQPAIGGAPGVGYPLVEPEVRVKLPESLTA